MDRLLFWLARLECRDAAWRLAVGDDEKVLRQVDRAARYMALGAALRRRRHLANAMAAAADPPPATIT